MSHTLVTLLGRGRVVREGTLSPLSRGSDANGSMRCLGRELRDLLQHLPG